MWKIGAESIISCGSSIDVITSAIAQLDAAVVMNCAKIKNMRDAVTLSRTIVLVIFQRISRKSLYDCKKSLRKLGFFRYDSRVNDVVRIIFLYLETALEYIKMAEI